MHIFWISAGLDDEPFAQLFLCQFPDGLLLLGSGIALGQGKGLALADIEQEGIFQLIGFQHLFPGEFARRLAHIGRDTVFIEYDAVGLAYHCLVAGDIRWIWYSSRPIRTGGKNR